MFLWCQNSSRGYRGTVYLPDQQTPTSRAGAAIESQSAAVARHNTQARALFLCLAVLSPPTHLHSYLPTRQPSSAETKKNLSAFPLSKSSTSLRSHHRAVAAPPSRSSPIPRAILPASRRAALAWSLSMPIKDHERDVVVDAEERPREKRRGSRSDRKAEGEKDREHRHRHRSSRSSKSRPTDSDVNSTSHRRHRTRDERPPSPPPPPPMEDTVPELSRSRDRVHVPYPSFSKAHSKENVHSREDLATPSRRTDPLTPEATDLGDG